MSRTCATKLSGTANVAQRESARDVQGEVQSLDQQNRYVNKHERKGTSQLAFKQEKF